MISFSFGRWSLSNGKYFLRKRIYLNGWRWTPIVRLIRRKKKTKINQLIVEMRKFRDIQGDSGNWNYDPYMHGMYNGMEFMLAMAENREPEFKEAPSEWLCDRSTEHIESEPVAIN